MKKFKETIELMQTVYDFKFLAYVCIGGIVVGLGLVNYYKANRIEKQMSLAIESCGTREAWYQRAKAICGGNVVSFAVTDVGVEAVCN